jgi:hypothetical protein
MIKSVLMRKRSKRSSVTIQFFRLTAVDPLLYNSNHSPRVSTDLVGLRIISVIITAPETSWMPPLMMMMLQSRHSRTETKEGDFMIAIGFARNETTVPFITVQEKLTRNGNLVRNLSWTVGGGVERRI